jgi:flagellin
MALSIRTNIASMNAQRNLAQTQTMLDSAMSHLSSGMRITKASDDAAGLAISTRLQAQVRSYNQAARNANDGLSMIQTAEQALNTMGNLLTRVRELAVQASNGTVAAADRTILQNEANALLQEVDRIADDASFNGVALLNAAGTLEIQVGVDDGDKIDVTLTDTSLAVANQVLDWTGGATDAADADLAQADLAQIDTEIGKVSNARAAFGAAANRLQGALENVQTFAESLSAANSRIRDVDVAEETAALSKAQVLAQAGISVLAQANQSPQMALKLLG